MSKLLRDAVLIVQDGDAVGIGEAIQVDTVALFSIDQPAYLSIQGMRAIGQGFDDLDPAEMISLPPCDLANLFRFRFLKRAWFVSEQGGHGPQEHP